VTTVGFREFIEVGDPVSQARIYEAQAVDELIFVDLDAARERRLADVSVVERAAEEVFMPFCVGGGVTTVDDFRRLLGSGADKVSVNTAALDDPLLLHRAAEAFGSQCVVLSIDVRRAADGAYSLYSHGGSVASPRSVVEWAQEGEALGAGEILLTSIDRDGSGLGLDIDLTRSVVDAVSVPVIASGGCGRASHFVDGFVDGGADAVSSGTYFSFRDQNPMQTRSQIRNAGVDIRFLT
jgi:cyclase